MLASKQANKNAKNNFLDLTAVTPIAATKNNTADQKDASVAQPEDQLH